MEKCSDKNSPWRYCLAALDFSKTCGDVYLISAKTLESYVPVDNDQELFNFCPMCGRKLKGKK